MGQNKGFLIYFLEILDEKGKIWRELLADEYLFCFYFKVVPYTSGKIWSARLIFLFFWQCVWIYPLQ